LSPLAPAAPVGPIGPAKRAQRTNAPTATSRTAQRVGMGQRNGPAEWASRTNIAGRAGRARISLVALGSSRPRRSSRPCKASTAHECCHSHSNSVAIAGSNAVAAETTDDPTASALQGCSNAGSNAVATEDATGTSAIRIDQVRRTCCAVPSAWASRAARSCGTSVAWARRLRVRHVTYDHAKELEKNVCSHARCDAAGTNGCGYASGWHRLGWRLLCYAPAAPVGPAGPVGPVGPSTGASVGIHPASRLSCFS
jgi:hypothetical protein